MTDVLHPVGDGLAVGNIQVVSNGVERFLAIGPTLGDGDYIAIDANQGAAFDTRMQARGPIALGDGALRGRFTRVGGNGGIELAIDLWRTDPRKASNAADLIARTGNFTVWHENWTEYSLPVIGRQCDQVARFMGDLWVRMVVISGIDGTGVPTLGVSALWLEVPDAAEVTFQDPTASPPPADTLVTVRTFSGRSATAKKVNGEWLDASDQPFEADSRSLPLGADGKPQASRAVNGWGA